MRPPSRNARQHNGEKKKRAEHVNHERWLVSYADFITLLFALFVVMFAASNSDEKKAGKIAKAVQVAFKEMGVFNPAGKAVPLYDDGGLPSDEKSVIGNTHSVFDASQFVDPGKRAAATQRTLKQVKTELEALLKDEISNNTVRLTEDPAALLSAWPRLGFLTRDPPLCIRSRWMLSIVSPPPCVR